MIVKRTKTILAVCTIILVTGCANKPKNNAIIANVSGDGNVVSINGSNVAETEMKDFLEETVIKTNNVETHGHVEDVAEIAFYEKNINVNILPSTSDDIELKLSGTVPKDGDVKLSPDLLNGRLIVNVEGNLINCNLTCTIGIPQKKFKNLIIEAENGNIKAVGDEINIHLMSFVTTNGNVKTNVFSEVFCVKTENGNIDSVFNVTKNAMITYLSQNGNIDVDIQNVKSLDASIYTENGRIKNNFVTNGEYTVDGEIHTSNGNIIIK